jgi:phage shock protein A
MRGLRSLATGQGRNDGARAEKSVGSCPSSSQASQTPPRPPAAYGNPQRWIGLWAIPSVGLLLLLPRPMGFFDRLSRLLRANLNDLVSKAEDPAKILDQSLADMQGDLVKLRQAVATAIASQRRLQNQAEQADTQAKAWYQRAETALKKGEEALAREALSRRKTYQDTATALSNQVNSQSGQVETLKKSLTALEAKIAEAKTKKDMLKARAQAAQAQEQIQTAVSNLGTNNAMAAFEQMEEKVLGLEARSQAAAELAGADLESQFAALEGSDVDEELADLKQRMEGGANPIQLPTANGPVPQLEPVKAAEVDAELRELKRSIDKL